MKKIYAFLLMSLTLHSCNDELTQREYLQFQSKLFDSGFRPQPIYVDREANPITFYYALKAQREHYEELLEDIDIFFPLESFPEEERIEADRKYRAFVQTHSKDKFLPLIRSRYSKFMLVDFRLLDTENYNQIKYYTYELIKAKSDKHDVLIRSLKKLKGNIAANEYAQIQKDAIDALEEQQKEKTNQLCKLREKIQELVIKYKETGEKPARHYVDSLENLMNPLEENAIACTIEEIAGL